MAQQPISIQDEGLTLRGIYYRPDSLVPKLAVLFLHGWTGRPNNSAACFLEQKGISSLTISLSGHGDSDGNIADQTRTRSLRQALMAYDLLSELSKLPIVVAGNSYGGYLAALIAGERQPAGLALRVPSLYYDEHADDQQVNHDGKNPLVRQWREQPRRFDESRALQAVHNFTGPIQILEAEHDKSVAPQVIQNYVMAITDPSQLEYHLMKDWPHSIGDSKEREAEFEAVLLPWLQTVISSLKV